MLAEKAKSLAKLVKVGLKDLITEHGVIKRKPVATSVNADTENRTTKNGVISANPLRHRCTLIQRIQVLKYSEYKERSNKAQTASEFELGEG